MKKRANIQALVLLAVFLMRVAVLAVHTHEPAYHTDYECEQCAHHTCHSGHLVELQLTDAECVLCQLCQLPFALALVLSATMLSFFVSYTRNAASRLVPCNRHYHKLGRAPPML